MSGITFKELIEHAKLIALKNDKQVKNGSNPKAPAITHDKNPPEYIGFNDPKYGTALVCDYIPGLNAYLTVIDIDREKNQSDINLDEIKKVIGVKNTYTKITPSGGMHIYLLSKEKPKAKQPKFNIDYQKGGKYVVASYRWNEDGTKKLFYENIYMDIPIMIVENSDKVLERIIDDLKNEGLIKNEIDLKIDEITEILKANIKKGNRQYYSCAISGYLKKVGFKQNQTYNIIERIFEDDEELSTRLDNVRLTYQKDNNRDVIGYNYLKEHLPRKDLERLTELTKNNSTEIRDKIINSLLYNKEPTFKMLFDYINTQLDLYQQLETRTFFQKMEDGRYKPIDEIDLVEFCNNDFGSNTISTKKCYECLKFITNPVKKNYNLIEFKNGILDTSIMEFKSKEEILDEIPKIALPLNWNEKPKGGELEAIIKSILVNAKYPRDYKLWLRIVGHAFMGNNTKGKMVVTVGASGTGKSTLTTILKRLFNYSMIPTSKIVLNERFTLHGLIDKDINIDDDINNGWLKGIGNLNTIITGDGLEVEVKGENRSIKAGNQQIPRLFANGNTLPPITGDGFRRLLLIHANNKIDPKDMDESLSYKITSGYYDSGLEWLIYTAITEFKKHEDQPIADSETMKEMLEEYEFQSDPLKLAIEELFQEDWEGENKFLVKDINHILKMWSKWAYKQGIINREDRRPSNTKIKKAMDRAGYDQGRTTKRIEEHNQEGYKLVDGSTSKTIRYYEDIKIRKNNKFFKDGFKYQ